MLGYSADSSVEDAVEQVFKLLTAEGTGVNGRCFGHRLRCRCTSECFACVGDVLGLEDLVGCLTVVARPPVFATILTKPCLLFGVWLVGSWFAVARLPRVLLGVNLIQHVSEIGHGCGLAEC